MDETLYDHIQGIARRITCNDDSYMDYAHDACVKVLDAQDKWNGVGTYKGWASIVAANCIIDNLRREGKRADFEARSVED